MPNLILALNATYIDESNKKVTLVREYAKGEADYLLGSRFRGDNGVSYQADGGVIGQVGNARIIQFGAVPLKSVYVAKPSLEVGKLYRNHLGKPAMIFGEVDPNSMQYRMGFRFFDERGSFYTADGSVQSRLFGKLDLVEQIMMSDVSDDEWAAIKQRELTQMEGLGKRDSMRTFFDKYLPAPVKGVGRFVSTVFNPRLSAHT